MNNIMQFQFENNNVRVIADEQNEPWFIAKEISELLDYSDAFEMTKKLDDDEKQNLQIAGFGPRGVTVINEGGLYSCILRSNKPEAKTFKRWITHEVIPSIRKTGSYGVQNLNDPAFLRATLLTYTEKVLALEAKIEDQAPKVEFHDAVHEAINCMTVQEVAKSIGIGEKKLFKFLRQDLILMEDPKNIPFQRFIDAGYFRVVVKQYYDGRAESHTYNQTLVTGKGLAYIQKRLAKRQKTIILS